MRFSYFNPAAGAGGSPTRRLGAPAWCLIAFLLAGCGSQGKAVAVANGHVITSKEVDERIARLNPALRQQVEKDRRRLVEQMVTETLLLQEAGRRGMDRDPEVRKLLQEARRQIMIGRLIEVVRGEMAGAVNDAEISRFYETNRASFTQPESWRASHILVADSAAAEKALARVKGGEPFAQVAQDLSTDPSKSRGGDIGFFSKGQVIPEFEAACRDLKPGEISKVVKTPLGYHVILLTEKRASREQTLDEVRDSIRQGLEGQQAQQKLDAYLQKLRSKAQVKIHEASAPSAAPAPESGTVAPSHSSP